MFFLFTNYLHNFCSNIIIIKSISKFFISFLFFFIRLFSTKSCFNQILKNLKIYSKRQHTCINALFIMDPDIKKYHVFAHAKKKIIVVLLLLNIMKINHRSKITMNEEQMANSWYQDVVDRFLLAFPRKNRYEK